MIAVTHREKPMHYLATAIVLATLLTLLSVPVRAAECGNGLLERDETCAACPADCTVEACRPTTPTRTVALSFTAPNDRTVNGATLVLAYRSRLVSLPGSGSDRSVRSRVKDTPANAIVAVNDRDYALRIVLARAAGIPAETIATVDFDGCQGASAPTVADFACVVEGCASAFGNVDDCACSVSLP